MSLLSTRYTSRTCRRLHNKHSFFSVWPYLPLSHTRYQLCFGAAAVLLNLSKSHFRVARCKYNTAEGARTHRRISVKDRSKVQDPYSYILEYSVVDTTYLDKREHHQRTNPFRERLMLISPCSNMKALHLVIIGCQQ